MRLVMEAAGCRVPLLIIKHYKLPGWWPWSPCFADPVTHSWLYNYWQDIAWARSRTWEKKQCLAAMESHCCRSMWSPNIPLWSTHITSLSPHSKNTTFASQARNHNSDDTKCLIQATILSPAFIHDRSPPALALSPPDPAPVLKPASFMNQCREGTLPALAAAQRWIFGERFLFWFWLVISERLFEIWCMNLVDLFNGWWSAIMKHYQNIHEHRKRTTMMPIINRYAIISIQHTKYWQP